jgi:hypothetical protein
MAEHRQFESRAIKVEKEDFLGRPDVVAETVGAAQPFDLMSLGVLVGVPPRAALGEWRVG